MKSTWTLAALSGLIATASARPAGSTQVWSELRKNVRCKVDQRKEPPTN